MHDILSSVFAWVVTVAVTLGIGKRLGHTLGPGPLNVVGSLVLVILMAPVVLLYFSLVESPHERRLRELAERESNAMAQ